MLASDGAVGFDPRVAVGDELEINDGDEAVVEELRQIIDDEIGAERAERFVVESDRDLARRRSSEGSEEEEGEDEESCGRRHWGLREKGLGFWI